MAGFNDQTAVGNDGVVRLIPLVLVVADKAVLVVPVGIVETACRFKLLGLHQFVLRLCLASHQ